MAFLQGIRIKNYKSLKDFRIGRLRDTPDAEPLTPITAFIGKNGVGKSSLLDALNFLQDFRIHGAEEACNKGRGGFEHIRTYGTNEPIEIEVNFLIDSKYLTYQLTVDKRPSYKIEAIEKIYDETEPFNPILDLNDVKNLSPDFRKKIADIAILYLKNKLKENKKIFSESEMEMIYNLKDANEILNRIKSWHFSEIDFKAAKVIAIEGAQSHLNVSGDNLGNVLQYFEESHPALLNEIFVKLSAIIPELTKVNTKMILNDQLVIEFWDKHFEKPFYLHHMSDGTLKLLAYLILLNEPDPPALIIIDEPENSLHHKLLDMLVYEFREFAEKKDSNQNIFVTTHQPYLIDKLTPDEVWVLDKDDSGFTIPSRCNQIMYVQNMYNEGLTLGSLWFSDYFDEVPIHAF